MQLERLTRIAKIQQNNFVIFNTLFETELRKQSFKKYIYICNYLKLIHSKRTFHSRKKKTRGIRY